MLRSIRDACATTHGVQGLLYAALCRTEDSSRKEPSSQCKKKIEQKSDESRTENRSRVVAHPDGASSGEGVRRGKHRLVPRVSLGVLEDDGVHVALVAVDGGALQPRPPAEIIINEMSRGCSHALRQVTPGEEFGRQKNIGEGATGREDTPILRIRDRRLELLRNTPSDNVLGSMQPTAQAQTKNPASDGRIAGTVRSRNQRKTSSRTLRM